MRFSIGEHYNIVCTVFGRRGSGKTTLCAEIAAGFKKLIVFDTRSRVDNQKSAHCDTFIPGAEKIFGDFGKLAEAIVRNPKGYRIIFTPVDPENDFDFFCEMMNSREINDTLLYIEEIGILGNPRQPLCDGFNKLLRFGRHNGIYILSNAQRPVDVHRAVTSNSSHIICFNQTEPRDLAYLSGFFGAETEKIRELPKYEFLLWKDNQITHFNEKRESKC